MGSLRKAHVHELEVAKDAEVQQTGTGAGWGEEKLPGASGPERVAASLGTVMPGVEQLQEVDRSAYLIPSPCPRPGKAGDGTAAVQLGAHPQFSSVVLEQESRSGLALGTVQERPGAEEPRNY